MWVEMVNLENMKNFVKTHKLQKLKKNEKMSSGFSNCNIFLNQHSYAFIKVFWISWICFSLSLLSRRHCSFKLGLVENREASGDYRSSIQSNTSFYSAVLILSFTILDENCAIFHRLQEKWIHLIWELSESRRGIEKQSEQFIAKGRFIGLLAHLTSQLFWNTLRNHPQNSD